MEILNRERKTCGCCMEEHEVFTVKEREIVEFKGQKVEYDAVYEYCENCGEYISTEGMLTQNYNAMTQAFKSLMG